MEFKEKCLLINSGVHWVNMKCKKNTSKKPTHHAYPNDSKSVSFVCYNGTKLEDFKLMSAALLYRLDQ